MKSLGKVHVALLLCGILVACIGALLASVLRAASHMSWNDQVPGQINRLALEIEMFHLNEDRYPKTLAELVSSTYITDKETLARMVNGGAVHYDYQPETNGFVITAATTAGLLNPAERMTKRFNQGEVWNGKGAQFHSEITNPVPQ
jgi:hypothetical protein